MSQRIMSLEDVFNASLRCRARDDSKMTCKYLLQDLLEIRYERPI